MVQGQPTFDRDLPDIVRRPFLAGRWMLAAASTVESALVLYGRHPDTLARIALVSLFVYTCLSMVIVYRLVLERRMVACLLLLDLLFVGFAAGNTGGPRSPFLGQFYLIVFTASLYFGLSGGIVVSVASVLITFLLDRGHPRGLSEDMRDLIPYFLVSGVFTGYLSQSMRSWFIRHREALERESAIALEAEQERRDRALALQLAEREADLARNMQRAALPAGVPTVPGLDIAARYEFAQEVGGDFHLFLPGQHGLDLVVGDVSGKGTAAALAATSISHLLPWLRRRDDPRATLRNLNSDLLDRLPDSAFATLVLAEVDADTNSLRIWQAGHPPALLWKQRDGMVHPAQTHNPLLGVMADWQGEPEDWCFEAGDVLVLYTDGLSETRNRSRVMFELEIPSVLAHSAAGGADEIADALLSAATAWGPRVDDLTLLVCKRTEDAA